MGLAPASRVTPLVFNPNNPVTGVVERIELCDGSDVVRKVICRDRPATVAHWPGGSERDHWNHWRREVHAYDEGFVHTFETSGLRAPALVGRVSPAEGVEVLFCEYVRGRTGVELDADDLARVAVALGRSQGAIASGRGGFTPANPAPWWSRDWMWRYALSRPGAQLYGDPDAWEHPVVVAGFGEARHGLRTRFAELLGEVYHWRAVTRSLPATVAHLDCWANNLIVAPGGDPVLIDWSFCGVGVVGEDPGNLVTGGFLDHYFEPEEYAAVDAAVWSAYASGLEDSGWPLAVEVARLGMCAAAMKFVWLPALMVQNAEFAGPTGYGGREGPDIVDVFRRRAGVFEAILERLSEARDLARDMELPG